VLSDDRLTLASVSSCRRVDVVVRYDRWSSDAGVVSAPAATPAPRAKRKCRNAQPRGIRARRASVARVCNVAVVEAAVLERGPRRAGRRCLIGGARGGPGSPPRGIAVRAARSRGWCRRDGPRRQRGRAGQESGADRCLQQPHDGDAERHQRCEDDREHGQRPQAAGEQGGRPPALPAPGAAGGDAGGGQAALPRPRGRTVSFASVEKAGKGRRRRFECSCAFPAKPESPGFAGLATMARPGLEPGTPRFSVVGPNLSNWAETPVNKRVSSKYPPAREVRNLRTYAGQLGTEIRFGTQSRSPGVAVLG
jgi:hypothetical protein